MNADGKFWVTVWAVVLGAAVSVLLIVAVWNITMNRAYVEGGYCGHELAGVTNSYIAWSKPPRCGSEPYRQ